MEPSSKPLICAGYVFMLTGVTLLCSIVGACMVWVTKFKDIIAASTKDNIGTNFSKLNKKAELVFIIIAVIFAVYVLALVIIYLIKESIPAAKWLLLGAFVLGAATLMTFYITVSTLDASLDNEFSTVMTTCSTWWSSPVKSDDINNKFKCQKIVDKFGSGVLSLGSRRTALRTSYQSLPWELFTSGANDDDNRLSFGGFREILIGCVMIWAGLYAKDKAGSVKVESTNA